MKHTVGFAVWGGHIDGTDEDRVCGVGLTHISGQAEANARLIAAAPELLADLRKAAATLRKYELLHQAKGTAESNAKAEVNAALAAQFEATIAKATGGAA